MARDLKLVHTFGNHNKPDKLIIVFHGLKTDGAAMLPAMSTLFSNYSAKGFYTPAQRSAMERRLPLVLMPEGPHKMAVRASDIPVIRRHYPSFTPRKSRAWFKIKGNKLVKMLTLRMSLRKINRFIDKQLKKYGLDDDRLVLMGYSQGGMMALYTGLSRKKPCAAVISHSGFYMGDHNGLFPVRSKPPVLAVMGDDDRLFNNPESRFPQHTDSVARLREAGIQVTNILIPDMGHDYNHHSLRLVQSYLTNKLKTGYDNWPGDIPVGGDYRLRLPKQAGAVPPLPPEERPHVMFELENGRKVTGPLSGTPLNTGHGTGNRVKHATLYVRGKPGNSPGR